MCVSRAVVRETTAQCSSCKERLDASRHGGRHPGHLRARCRFISLERLLLLKPFAMKPICRTAVFLGLSASWVGCTDLTDVGGEGDTQEAAKTVTNGLSSVNGLS